MKQILIGEYKVSLFNHGNFKLDGGAMFGSVPKNIWSKLIEADQQNRIPLATNSLIIEGQNRKFLVDLGLGNKWSDKQRLIYQIENNSSVPIAGITDIIITHLHFDHAGGISYLDAQGQLQLTYPDAHYWLQESNLTHAKSPGIKERASYLNENITLLDSARLNLIDGDVEIAPGILLHRIDGHTIGQQWLEIVNQGQYLFFPSDLIPTSHHINPAYHLGYDIHAALAIKEKIKLLEDAVLKNALIAYQHDINRFLSRIKKDTADNYQLADI